MKRVNPKPNDLYLHFKGKLYKVITVASDCETTEPVVVYENLYPPFSTWVRTLKDFMGELEEERFSSKDNVTGQKYRFQRVKYDKNLKLRYVSAEFIKEGEKNKTKEDYSEVKSEVNVSNSNLEVSEDKSSIVTSNKDESKEITTVDLKDVLMTFLDASSPKEKKEIIRKYRKYLDEQTVVSMALSLDIKLAGEDLDDNISHILSFLNAREHFDGRRLRS